MLSNKSFGKDNIPVMRTKLKVLGLVELKQIVELLAPFMEISK